MSTAAIAEVMAMDLTPCEFALLMRIADSPSDGTLHFPNWERICESTGCTVPQINRMLTGLVTDGLIFTTGVLFMPIVSECNHNVAILIGEPESRSTQRPAPSQTKNVERPGYIYLIHGEGTPWYKIGLSKSPEVRRAQLGTKGPFHYNLLHSFAVDDMDTAERIMHSHFANKAAEGEWFRLDANDIALIQRLSYCTTEDLLAALVTGV
jgi:hypothetical protein